MTRKLLLAPLIVFFAGAPWDMEFTPNFKVKIEEASITWPPQSPLIYPLKNW